MKIACIGYRDWALKIYSQLELKFLDYDFLIQSSEDDYSENEISRFNPDLIFFYGWSRLISKSLINNYKCLMLHPSPLPKYRGGSPIQNQIINGETDSAVTIFLMDEGVDTGPIAKQVPLSLQGSLNDIFDRIIENGFEVSMDIITNGLQLTDQNGAEATYCKRRRNSESEITLDEIQFESAKYLRNKIRMLQDPYPNPYIKTYDGKKLVIKLVEIEE